jgi:mRNA-degrading endonuclease toxin of MazEF toxin-antitoxin module
VIRTFAALNSKGGVGKTTLRLRADRHPGCGRTPAGRSAQPVARPYLAVSPTETNAHLGTVSVAPLSSSSLPAPFRVPIRLTGMRGLVLVEQVTAADAATMQRRVGKANQATLAAVPATLQEHFADEGLRKRFFAPM